MADEALTAGAVARRLGVAVTTLRTWHQRYGLGPSQHLPGQHRRYTDEDLERLQVMRRLTAQGVAPAEAAAWARRVPMPIDVVWPEVGGGLTVTTRDGGGHTIRTGRAGPAARGLARAAMRLDAPALREILETAVAGRGVIGAWHDVIMPVLIGIGDRYAATRRFIEVEHLLSRSITEVLGSVARPPSSQAPRVMLAAADEEQHTLPLEALAAALAEAGVPSRLLGARVPPQALTDAVARTGPAAVVLWSQLAETGDPTQWTRLLSSGHGPLLAAAAGPGWPADRLPEGVVRLDSLDQAVRLVAAAARGCPAPR
ncbi:MerR family transcriptional regulator [Couchioplanes caeruleus]|uniref:MerR family transcriptional regulator n=2 Tax=Couchioplanes caeruleus TaxID=56438 RepID=A0A1K0GE72_9ACTN|nr:MerR family transcriptional regulator [Couchioplanes caeruleus]OJF15530.1 MerR family transcriptional regulator [Couchioplanes caeruleus subsp. caeruleus]ROP30929.1 B12 binding protein [Couchioplanes caeruleus]